MPRREWQLPLAIIVMAYVSSMRRSRWPMSMAGAVRLMMTEVLVRRFTPGLRAELEQPLSCPTCGQWEMLTLVAQGRDAHIECSSGHAWTDSYIVASTVRQMDHMAAMGAPVWCPGVKVYESLVPRLDEDQTLYHEPAIPEALDKGEFRKRDWWMASAAAVAGWPAFTECLRFARKLTIHALPACGSLYERLYPRAGGSAVDAHMSIVVLALAMLEAAYQADTTNIGRVPLSDVEATLRPECAGVLRGIRPPSHRRDYASHLRVTDVERLEEADGAEWDRWCQAATDILSYHIEDRRDWHRHVAGRHTEDDEITVSDCCAQMDLLDDDLTWYVAPEPSSTE
ncbi:hypothetical protein ACWD6P_10735 [Streptomyces sp. NPDC002446]